MKKLLKNSHMPRGLLLLILLFSITTVFSQELVLLGEVFDKTHDFLYGVNIYKKGDPTNGVISDIDGKFTIKNINTGDHLILSYIGYKSQEIEIKNDQFLSIEMVSSIKGLDEVVVTGYGIQKKSSFTGAVGSVDKTKLENSTLSNPIKALEGAASGVQVLSGSGQPGSSPTIRIRGISSLNASKEPLIVVDGMIYDGSISDIAANDIESMNVLKDAAATSLYGAKGGNGVIIITTKKGQEGDVKITIRSSVGVSERGIPEFEKLNARQHYELAMEGYAKGFARANKMPIEDVMQYITGEETKYGNLDLIKMVLGSNMYNVPITDLFTYNSERSSFTLNPKAKPLYNGDMWEDEMYRKGIKLNNSIAISGGNKDLKYYISASSLDEKGILRDSDFKRNSLRAKVTAKLKPWWSTGLNLMIAQSKSSFTKETGGSNSNVFEWMRNIAPIYPMYVRDAKGVLIKDNQGNKIIDYGNGNGIKGQGNFVREFAQGSSILSRKNDPQWIKKNTVNANLYTEIKPFNGLSLKLVYNKYLSNRNGLTYMNMLEGWGKSHGGSSERQFYTGDTYSLQQFITYDRKIGNHHFNVSMIHENYETGNSMMSNKKQGFPIPSLMENTAAAVIKATGSGAGKYRTEAFLFKANDNFADKYYFNVSLRKEASSRFHEDNRWGTFWALGGAWRITGEDFMEDVSFIDNLRLKASYGTNGNDKLGGLYAYQSFYKVIHHNTNMPGIRFGAFKNKKLTWEKQNKLNVGVDVSLFNRLINLEVDYFNTKTTDLLFDKALPYSSGLANMTDNVGALVNKGFEYVITCHPIQKSVKWDLSLNLTHYKNEITALSSKMLRHGNQAYKVGKSAYEFYMFQSAGIDSETGNYLWWQDVRNSKGEIIRSKKTSNINKATERWLGSSLPDFFGGISNTVSYKNLSLFVNCTYSVGGKVIDHEYEALMHRSPSGTAWHKDISSRWTHEGQKTEVPSVIWQGSQTSTTIQDRYMTDASYFNISNVNLSYKMSKAVCKKIGLTGVTFNASVDNLYMFTKRKGLNPANSLNGSSVSLYPQLRTYTIGTVINF